MKKFTLPILCALIFGCQQNTDSASAVKGHEYLLLDAPAGLEISLGFDGSSNDFHGQAINNYFGSYSLNGSKIRFSLAGSTMMSGPREQMQAEREYFINLDQMDTITVEGNQLQLQGKGKTLRFKQQ